MKSLPFISICEIFSNFAVTLLAELIILGGFNEERYITGGYFNVHLSMSLAVMAESSYTHSVLKVSTASSLILLLSVTAFGDCQPAKPNSTCLQCTWFYSSQGSNSASFRYESACSRTYFLIKRPIKVTKRSFNDCPKKGAIICLELEQKWLKLFRHGDEELHLGHHQWVLSCFFDCSI